MEYDYRKRTGGHGQSYGRVPPSDAHAPSLYPQIGAAGTAASHAQNHPPFHHAPPPPPPAPSNPGLGIRVAIKPEYRITPPPTLLPQLGEIPRSNFHFDFEFERNVLIEAVKESPNWSRLGIANVLPKATEPVSSYGATADPVVSKYIAAGLNREAVPLAVANFGDNPSKVKEFASGYALLREMGFSSNNVAEALLMYDNDTDKALAHFLNGAS